MALNITAQDVTAYDKGMSAADLRRLSNTLEFFESIQARLNKHMAETPYHFDVFARMGSLADTFIIPEYMGEWGDSPARFVLLGGVETEGDYALYETEGVDDMLTDSEPAMYEAYEKAVEFVNKVFSHAEGDALAETQVDWLFLGMYMDRKTPYPYPVAAAMDVADGETAFTKNYTIDAD